MTPDIPNDIPKNNKVTPLIKKIKDAKTNAEKAAQNVINNSNADKCGVILLYCDEDNSENWETIMVKQKSTDYFGWPKGERNSNESYEECAIRELKEETGITININKKSDMTKILPICHNKMLLYVIRVKTKIPIKYKKVPHKSEISEIEWIKLSELLENDNNIKINSSSVFKSINDRNLFKIKRSYHTHHILKSLLLELNLIQGK